MNERKRRLQWSEFLMRPFAKNLLASQLYCEMRVSFTKSSLSSNNWKERLERHKLWNVISNHALILCHQPVWNNNFTVASFSSQPSTTISQEKTTTLKSKLFDLTLPHRNYIWPPCPVSWIQTAILTVCLHNQLANFNIQSLTIRNPSRQRLH